METARVAESISGKKLYQLRARLAFPILVRQALVKKPINYSHLAIELGIPNPRNLNYILGSVGTTLELLASSWKEKIPPLQCIVINKNTGLPGEGIGWFLMKKEDFKKLSRNQQRKYVEVELQRIYDYSKWLKILEALKLPEPVIDFSDIISASVTYGSGGGESEAHRSLKEYVALHPEIVDLPSSSISQIEFPLPSGDCIDVLSRPKKSLHVSSSSPGGSGGILTCQ